jgi:hypothetical protein
MKTNKPDVFRFNRFRLEGEGLTYGDENFALVKSVVIRKKKLIISFYLAEENLSFLYVHKWPSKLKVALVAGDGTVKARIIFYGVEFVKNVIKSLNFDYQKTDVQVLKVKLEYSNSSLVLVEEKKDQA